MNFVNFPQPSSANSLPGLRFENSFLNELPEDPLQENYCRQVRGACYSRVMPKPMENPQMLAFSRETAELVGLSEEQCQSREFAEIFTGNAFLEGMEPFAMCYGGISSGIGPGSWETGEP